MTVSLESLEAEMALAKKLESLNVDTNCFTGMTTMPQRKEIVRRSILTHQLEGVLFTVERGRQISLASQFRKAYGEDIHGSP